MGILLQAEAALLHGAPLRRSRDLVRDLRHGGRLAREAARRAGRRRDEQLRLEVRAKENLLAAVHMHMR